MSDVLEIDGAEAQEQLRGDAPPLLIDVREDYEVDASRIPGSVHIALGELPWRAGELDRERELIVYCRAGVRSLMAAQALSRAGWHARSLHGGLLDWAAAGRPLDPPSGAVAQERALT